MTDSPDPHRMTGAKLVEALTGLGMTINDASRAWGADRRRVVRWVQGEEDIPPWVPVVLILAKALLETMHRLEERTGVTIHTRMAAGALYLATGKDYHPHSPTPSLVRETDEADDASRDMD